MVFLILGDAHEQSADGLILGLGGQVTVSIGRRLLPPHVLFKHLPHPATMGPLRMGRSHLPAG